MKKEPCNNACNKAWCCSSERVLDAKKRWTKEAIALSAMKGITVYEWNDTHVVLHFKCPCIALEQGNECFLTEIGKPEYCRKFPTEEHNGMILTEKCKYFDSGRHISFERLKKYKPEV
jgi:hypothetical protein